MVKMAKTCDVPRGMRDGTLAGIFCVTMSRMSSRCFVREVHLMPGIEIVVEFVAGLDPDRFADEILRRL
jgi:hypothetical protein